LRWEGAPPLRPGEADRPAALPVSDTALLQGNTEQEADNEEPVLLRRNMEGDADRMRTTASQQVTECHLIQSPRWGNQTLTGVIDLKNVCKLENPPPPKKKVTGQEKT
jgi:hypothetical protein